MKNVRRLYAPLSYTVMAFLFFYISEMLCSHFVRLELRSSYDNTPYRKEAVMFLLSSPGTDFVDLTEAVEDGLLEGCAVLRYDDESYGMNEVIYCDQGVIGIYGMEAFDFFSGEKIAVAGADSGYGIGDTVTVDAVEYPVEGILERHISMAINTGVFYSYCDLSHVPTQKVYVLTAKNGGRIAEAYTGLEELIKSRGAEIRSREMSRARFSDYVDYRGVTFILFGVLGFFYVGLICLFAHIWLRIKEPEIQVLNLLGYGHIWSKVWGEYFVVWLFAFLMSLGVNYVSFHESCYSIVTVVSVALVLLLVTLSGGYAFFEAQAIKGRVSKEAVEK